VRTTTTTEPTCRSCGSAGLHEVLDLGMTPLSNAFLRAPQLRCMEPFYPLRVLVCEACFLVQAEAYESRETIFSGDYAYFSSFSESWLRHARDYAGAVLERFRLDRTGLVVEVASNDGYLLQFFARAGVRVLGVEPAANVARAAVDKGIPTEVAFFGRDTADRLAERGDRADLLVANNVLAHVPDLADFVGGLARLLKPHGVLTLEFPHLGRLVADGLFDTVYHEHYSYISLIAAEAIFSAHGLVVFDVERLATHGGSLRLFARHAASSGHPVSAAVDSLREEERAAGLDRLETYGSLQPRACDAKVEAIEFLARARREGKRVAGYGAPAKATTFLNFCGIRGDLIAYTVDRSPWKQGRFVPGVHLPIHAPEKLLADRPDLVVIFPWNLQGEVMAQMGAVREWGGRFVTLVPHPVVLQ